MGSIKNRRAEKSGGIYDRAGDPNDITQTKRIFCYRSYAFPGIPAKQLGKLKASLQCHETELNDALQQDLGKSRMESYMCEIGLTLSELTWMQKHLWG